MDTNYLIIPGFGNSDQKHWQTYFEKHLTNCVRVQQKSWEKPIRNDWLRAIYEAVMQYNPTSVVLISHSMGGIAIAHWAREFNIKIKGAMIVAPPDLENPWQDLGFESFVPIPLLKFPFPSMIIASLDDHWASKERTQAFAQNWGSKLLFLNDAGHINTTSGYGEWKEGLRILKNEFP
ncbi:MAG: hypothetical protein RL711_6 [Bacteroidota bacterium]|jgi:predicted alpha/beta hydrolase family esterase